MISDKLQYRSGYKYSTWEDYFFQTEIRGYAFKNRLFEMTADGIVTVFADYPYDGASGPTIDTDTSMRGALEHDVMFEMMRLGLIPQTLFHVANLQLHKTIMKDGMWPWRAGRWLAMVERFGHPAAAVKPAVIRSAP